jgi:uncharacterized protein (TIGR04222 family)
MHGPQFLVFYAILSLGVYLWVRHAIATRESTFATPVPRLRDPYEIAYLRGGTPRLVEVAVLSLLRRRWLDVVAGNLRSRDSAGSAAPVAPIEAAILDACRSTRPAFLLASQTSVQVAAERYRLALAGRGLMPNEAANRARRRLAAAAILGLAGLAVAKITAALATGHRNVGFLILLGVAVAAVLWTITRKPRTTLGDETLTNLKSLFARVKTGPRPLGADQHHEALLLAAVFGEFAVAGMEPSGWKKLFPARSARGGGDGGSCSSCGGGSGCGGGGGCGGCGS